MAHPRQMLRLWNFLLLTEVDSDVRFTLSCYPNDGTNTATAIGGRRKGQDLLMPTEMKEATELP
jgi:hypothetical protein